MEPGPAQQAADTSMNFDPIDDAISSSCLLTADNFPSLALDDPSTFALRPESAAPQSPGPLPFSFPFPIPASSSTPALAPVIPSPPRQVPSEKALGKRPESKLQSSSASSRIRLNPTKSHALALLAASNPTLLNPVAPKLALFDVPPPAPVLNPSTAAAQSASSASSSHVPTPAAATAAVSSANETDPAFFAPNGRSLRARVVRPSYLEIPPASVPLPVASTSTAPSSAAPSRATSIELQDPARLDGSAAKGKVEAAKEARVTMSEKSVKKFKRWTKERRYRATNGGGRDAGDDASSEMSDDASDRDEGGGNSRKRARRKRNPSGSSLSSLSSDDYDPDRASVSSSSRRKPKAKRRKKQHDGDSDGDSSPLSSLDSNDDEGGDPDASTRIASPKKKRVLAFPDKPSFHPLNQFCRKKPTPPPTPPCLDVFKVHQLEMNPFSWAEGLSEITYGGQVVEPTNEEDVEDLEQDGGGPGMGGSTLQQQQQSQSQQGKKRPGWEWETTIDHAALARSVSPAAAIGNRGGASLAHPPPATTTSFLSVPTSLSTAARVPAFLSAPSSATQPPPTTTTTVTTTLREVIPRPKTYRQIARLDWSDFHQRHKCRFTTSGAVEGVNPEGLAWESWYGVEDEPVAAVRRLNQVDPARAKGLVVLQVGAPAILRDLGGAGHEGDLDRIEVETPFDGGMEWYNEWRFKTLEEGMGNTWEARCRWAVRNPERKYLSSSSEDEPETPAEKARREKMAAMKEQRKRERKKAKREKARKEREGSGGESELTPLEGEELSTDSEATDEDPNNLDAATIARHSSLLMNAAAEAHNAKRRKTVGVMVECPIPNCPQRFYRSKAGSSVATHDRHYHTPSITIKYWTGVSAFIQRDANGDFVCPAPECGFITKSRGTFAVHGKPEKGNCRGPPETIPKPKGYVKPKKPKKPKEPKAPKAKTRVQKLANDVPPAVDDNTPSASTSAASSPQDTTVAITALPSDAQPSVEAPEPSSKIKIKTRGRPRKVQSAPAVDDTPSASTSAVSSPGDTTVGTTALPSDAQPSVEAPEPSLKIKLKRGRPRKTPLAVAEARPAAQETPSEPVVDPDSTMRDS